MNTLIIITAIYILLIVLVVALCKVRAVSDKKAKEIFNNKTKCVKKIIKQIK